MVMRETPEVALLSIKPRFAEAILAGTKRVEFRRRRLADTVRHIVVYSTQPVGTVVGSCGVSGQLSATPDELWSAVGDVGGISREEFDTYFEGAVQAVAILLEKPSRLSPHRAVSLNDLGAARPPQSFQYLHRSVRNTLSGTAA